jgi:hypothetical protein
MKNDQEAFNLGRRAYFRGAESTDNPYPDDEANANKHWSWNRGFDTAYEEEDENAVPHWLTYRS